jgi:YVTN family beta-propeller protein
MVPWLVACAAVLWPRPAAANGVGTIFVTHQGASAVTILEHAGGTVLTTLAVAGVPSGVAFTGDGQLALVGSRDSGALTIIDRDLYEVTGSVRVGGAVPAVAAPGDAPVWVAADADGNRLVVFDGAGATLRIIPTPGKPLALAATQAARLYTLVEGASELAVFDVRSGAAEPGIPIEGAGASLALSPDGATAYVALPEAQALAVVDLAGRTARPIPLGEVPAGVALGPDGRVYVAAPRVNSLLVVDSASHRVTGRIGVGRQPLGVGVSTERGALAYVANNGDDTVAVVDLATQVLVKTVPVGPAPSGVAIARSRTAAVAQAAAQANAGTAGAAGAGSAGGAGAPGTTTRVPVPRDLPNTGAAGAARPFILPFAIICLWLGALLAGFHFGARRQAVLARASHDRER